MKNKRYLKVVSLLIAVILLFSTLTSCGPEENDAGLSAYEIAVKNGFKGSENEWLESLKIPGESAYDIAVRNGFTGSEEEWLESLKIPGESAYDIAVKNGFTGSEEEWFESLASLSVKSAHIDNNHLIIVLSDDTVIDAGEIGTAGIFVVSFDLNYSGASNETAPTAQTVVKNSCATLPTPPLRSGYRFTGWFTDNACTNAFYFTTPITENLTLYAGWTQDTSPDSLTELRQEELNAIETLNGGVMPEISINTNSFLPSFISGSYSSQTVTNFDSALSSLNDVSSLMGFENLSQEFSEAGTNTFNGVTQYRLQQTYAGYPVFGKQMVVTTDSVGNTTALSGSYAPVAATLNSSREISAEQAAVIVGENGYGSATAADAVLVIYTLNGYNEYAYVFSTDTYDVAISAVDGTVLSAVAKLVAALPTDVENMTAAIGRGENTQTDVFNTVYYSTEDIHLFYDSVRNVAYHDRNGVSSDSATSFLSVDVLRDDDNVWTSAESDYAIDLYNNISAVYDFYLESLGLLSFDGDGGRILAYINDGWDNGDNAGSLTITDENGSVYTILTFGMDTYYHQAIDVVAHEYTHSIQNALVDNLQYSNQTGALMEAYADVMGELIQLEIKGQTDWICAGRNLMNPEESNQPVKFNGARYYVGEDQGNYVHTNSTVISHAIYKIYDTDLFTVDQMTELLFRSWSYLSADATFYDYRMSLLAAARDMGFAEDQINAITTSFEAADIIPASYNAVFNNPIDVTVVVINSTDSTPVSGANVTFLIPGNNDRVLADTYAGDDGNASLSLRAGHYRVNVEAIGYTAYEGFHTLSISDSETIVIRLDPESNQDEVIICELGGTVSNALTGERLSDVTMNFRKGYNVTTGRIDLTLTTDSEGQFYTGDLDSGYYTIELIKDGFIVSYALCQAAASNWEESIRQDALSQTISISPYITSDDTLRIVLSWGATPSDLDSHLVGINPAGDRYHVYYSIKNHSWGGDECANLDIDDTTSYGPETITVFLNVQGGNFSYLIHDYSNRSSTNSTSMSNSGATVSVYSGNTLLRVFNVPTNTVGTVWHVFDYDATTGTLVGVNEFFNQSDPGAVAPQTGNAE